MRNIGSSQEGLSSEEASRRLMTAGAGIFAVRHLWWRAVNLVRSFFNPLVMILLFAGLASAYLGEKTDALIISGIVLLSAVINFWQTFRSERAVKRLQKGIAPTATVRRDGGWIEIARERVVVGDIVRLSSGDLVPADARLIEATDLHIQQAALTGESLPAEKFVDAGAIASISPDSPNLVFLGSSVVSGVATAVIFAAGKDTAFGEIVERLGERPEETEFERGTRQFGLLILQTVVFLVFFILVINISLGRDALQSLLFSVALAVGLTPEFLPMITTVTLAQGAIRMAREKVIVRHLSAIQNLGSIDVLCSDKTGTLTEGTMSLAESLEPFGSKSDRPLLLARLNSRFESGIKSSIDAAILAAPFSAAEDGEFEKTDEIPFDFERRRLSVVVRDKKKNEFHLIVKGAPESIFDICSRFEARESTDGSVVTQSFDEDSRTRCMEKIRALSQEGFRVIAVGHRRVSRPSGFNRDDESDLTLIGLLTFADHLIGDVAASIEALRKDGVRIKILTGDNELVTSHICRQAGIHPKKIVLGRELERMDDAGLAQVVERTQVFARVTPSQKHRIVQALKARGHVVGFLGDGINDAPSLHAADVGISVASAVDVAREAADIVLLEPRLNVLHAGIIAGRRSFGNVLKYLLMGTSSNFGNMFSMAGAALFLPFLPMLPTQILLNNFLYDFAQITIPTDNVDAIFIRRPQRWNIRLIRDFMLIIGPLSSVYDFLTFYVLLKFLHFDERLFHTGWFLESLATQTLVLFVIRTVGRPWTNRPSWPMIVTTIAVVVLGGLLPFSSLGGTLGFDSLPPVYFIFLAVVVGTYLCIVEIVKHRVIGRLFVNHHRG